MRFLFCLPLLILLSLLSAALYAQALIKDICPGLKGSSPEQLINIKGTIYFVANDGIHGKELWKSNGTPESTVLVKDIIPGSEGSDIQEMTNVNGMLYFSAVTTGSCVGEISTARQLWRSDGTPAGTNYVCAGHKIGELLNPVELTAVGDAIYYVKFNALGGFDHWQVEKVSNSETIAGEVQKFKFNPATDGNHPPTELTQVNDDLYFTYKGDLWKSNGPTTIVKPDLKPRSLVSYKGALFFAAGFSQSELWTSKGTEASTQKLTSIASGLGGGLRNLVVAGQYLFFSAGTGGKDLWVSNGTSKGTKKLASFTGMAREITNLSSPNPGQPKTDKTYFTAGTGSELYFTDGSIVIKVKGTTTQRVHNLVRSKGALYFTAGTNLLKTSGIEAEMVASSSYYSFNLTDADNRLFFSHDNPGMGFELYWLEASGGFPPF